MKITMENIVQAAVAQPRFVVEKEPVVVIREQPPEIEFLLSSFGLGKKPRYQMEARTAKKAAEFYNIIRELITENWFELKKPDAESMLESNKRRLEYEIGVIKGPEGNLVVKTNVLQKRLRVLKDRLEWLTRKETTTGLHIEPMIVKSAWPLNIFTCDFVTWQKTLILRPHEVIIHIENSVFALFYMSRCNKLIFKNKVKDNIEYQRRHQNKDQPIPIVYRSVASLEEAYLFLEEGTQESDEALRTKALARFRKHFKKSKPICWEWITNYDFGLAKCFEVGPQFELLLVMASQLGKRRNEAVLRAISFLIIMNSNYPNPKVEIVSRKKTQSGTITNFSETPITQKEEESNQMKPESRMTQKLRKLYEQLDSQQIKL